MVKATSDALRDLLVACRVDYAVLTGPQCEARDKEARFAACVLLELSESVHPGPMIDYMAIWESRVA